jgi:DNA-binding NarL/FixJ family response regulator
MIRVVVVDDQEVVRRGLVQLLDAEPDMHVVGEAATAARAHSVITTLRPDVVTVDVNLGMSGDSGSAMCRELCAAMKSSPAFLMFTSRSDDAALFGAIAAGAAGYLLKHVRGNDIVAAVRRVANGESLLDPRLVESVMDRVRHGPLPIESRYETLSDPERRIIDLIAEGLTNRQIGARLFVTEKTVKNNVSFILRKLGVDRRTQAAVIAVQRGAGRRYRASAVA